ncbi:MAG: transporter substrate-binding domain-containing protein [Clostridiales Family XIII bacterium]|jgi:signal transduction histidine kinase/ActR/RegA family two-component response regulator/HPt (histidine-containing phosphotransfer) domain-containing protein|nr:transporter substrate-binding domain-containing protein [Clostridiales Family XIII bacterium]
MKLSLRILLPVLAVAMLASLCTMQAQPRAYAQDTGAGAQQIHSFRDIPGITEEQVAAVEAALEGRASFSYGMRDSSECFVREDGSLGGFAVLLTDRLSGLFGVPFELELCGWPELSDLVREGAVDFSGDYRPSGDAEKSMFMTDTIVERAVKMARLEDAAPIENIVQERPARFGFLKGAVSRTLIEGNLEEGSYEILEVEGARDALAKLRAGEIDLFVADSTIISTLLTEEDVEVSNYTPLTYKRVSITTADESLAPVLEAIDLYLQNGGFAELSEYYSKGYEDFSRMAFLKSLTAEERAWLDAHTGAGGAPVPLAVSPANYPVNFYNENDGTWSGIALDVLAEIEKITDIRFDIVNTPEEGWPVVFKMLEDGDAAMVAELIRTDEREGRFLFGQPYANDRYVLLSRTDFPAISINQVLYANVGLIADTGFMEMFQQWFPDNHNTPVYPNIYEAYDALEAGEIDYVMATENRLLAVTNYMERSGFKINLVFDHSSDSQYGFNLNEGTLASVIGKAQRLVDTEGIASLWMHMTYDYEKSIAQTRTLYMVLVAALLVAVVLLLVRRLMLKRTSEAELQALVKERTVELEAASNAKSDFLANMSHEMRTPLNAVIGLAELSLSEDDEKGGLAEDTRESLQKIYGSGVTLLGLVNDLLDLSKIESGKFELVPIEYDVPSMINDTVTLNIIRIGSKPIEFRVDADPGLPVRMYGDELRIKQIFNNLLSNAFKYTKEGEVTWSLRQEEGGAEGECVLVSEVRDTGIGIRPEDLAKIFEEYNQVDTKANRKIEGTGLGLAITRRMAEMMGGTLEAESVYGEGSVFRLRLPQKVISSKGIGERTANNLASFRYGERKLDRGRKMTRVRIPYARVLVVDDVVTNLDVAKGLMKPYGMQVDTAENGREAVELIRRGEPRYNAVFMDHMMPEMDGMEAVRIIRSEIGTPYAEEVPIIALTANALVGNDELFRQNGFDDFLSKPIDIIALDGAIQRWVRDRAEEERLAAAGALPGAPGPVAEHGGGGGAGADAGAGEGEGADGLFAGRCVEGVDLEEGLARFGGDAEAYLDVLVSYVKNTGAILDRLEDPTGDTLPAYGIDVHGVKGASRSIGADGIGARAEALEHAAKAGDLAAVERDGPAFLADARALLGALGVLTGELAGAAQGGKEMRPEPSKETLEQLRCACAQFDVDAAEEAIEALSCYSYESGGDLVPWLKERVAISDFKSVVQKLGGV